MKTPNPDHPIRNTLKHLALAFALGVGLGAGSALAQPIIEVGGAGTIGVTPMTTAKVPATGVNWTAAGGQSGAGGGGIYSGLVSTAATTIAATGNVTLTFDHTYHFESGWDGGAVFVSINGGAFTYLPGSSFTTGGYDGITVSSAWPAGTAGRPAVFYSDTPKSVQSVADLGTWPAGTKIAVEFRGGWDEGLVRGPVAWEISTVKLTDAGPNDILKLNFTVDGPSGFTVSNIGTVAGPWKYLKPISKFEINADDLTADQYSLPVEVGTVIDLNNAKLSVVLLSGTLDPGDMFALFDLASGTTLTGAIDSISLPIGRWNTTNLAVNGTITYLGPPIPECPLGVWKPSANRGINPATGVAWAVGDTYRLAFVSSGTTTFVSNDIATYNSFVQGLAAASTKFPKLGNGTWKVLGSTEAENAKVNTGTNTGTGVPVLLMDGTTVFATNNADLWNGCPTRSGGTYYSVYMNENGVDVGFAQVGTGTNSSGGTVAAQWFGNSNGSTIVNLGLTTPNRYDRWMIQYHASNETPLRVYALSAPLTLQAMVVAKSYGDWAGGSFPSGKTLTDTNPALDFDNGGLPTGIEWVVGGDPTDGSDDAGKAPTFDNTTDPDNFLFIFRRSTAAGEDANTSIVAQYSSNLSGWTPAQTGVDGVTITPETDGFGSGIDKVTVAIPRTLALDNKLFVRLNVVVTTP